MKKLALASVLAGAIALTSGCKPEEKQPPETTGMSLDEILAHNEAKMQTRLDQYLIDVNDIPVTRNGEDFTVSVQAFCNTIPQADVPAYTEACAKIATGSIQTQFACAGYSIPVAMTKTYSEDILSAGFQGQYDPRYLFSEEKLKAKITDSDKRIVKENIVILSNISDLEAAKRTYKREGEKPDFCPD